MVALLVLHPLQCSFLAQRTLALLTTLAAQDYGDDGGEDGGDGGGDDEVHDGDAVHDGGPGWQPPAWLWGLLGRPPRDPFAEWKNV